MIRLLGRAELIVEAAFLAAFVVFRCASTPEPVVRAQVIAAHVGPARDGGPTYYVTVEYVERETAATVHRQMEVTIEQYLRMRSTFEVCFADRPDGIQLRSCE